MFSIFIAYRQSDAKAWAILLRDALVHAFGDASVFLDQDALQAGPWPDQLRLAVQHCKVMLVVIGRHWLDASDSAGQRRLWAHDDVHRLEIALALAQPGITVLPVRVDGASMPQAADLPAAISALALMQSHQLGESQRRRQADIAAIVDSVALLTGLTPAGPVAPNPPASRGWPVLASTLLLTGAVATLFSRASMRLSVAELAVLLLLAFVASSATRALWRWLTRWRRGA